MEQKLKRAAEKKMIRVYEEIKFFLWMTGVKIIYKMKELRKIALRETGLSSSF